MKIPIPRNYWLWISGAAGLLLIVLTTQPWIHALCFLLVFTIYMLAIQTTQSGQEIMLQDKQNTQVIQSKFDKVGRQLSSILEEETDNIHENMERIKSLVHESTEQLHSSFNMVVTNTNSQKTKSRELVDKLAEINDPNNEDSVTASLEQASTLLDAMTQQLININNKSRLAENHVANTTRQLKNISFLLNNIQELGLQNYQQAMSSAVDESAAQPVQQQMETMCSQIRDSIATTQETIDEVNQLVADINAVDINTLKEEKMIITGLLDNVEEISHHTRQSINELADTSEAIGVEIYKSIQAMQFEDIVNQLSTGMQCRLDHINEIGSAIFPHTTIEHDITYHLDYASDKLSELRNEFHDKRLGEKVSQSSMSEGDIDLF